MHLVCFLYCQNLGNPEMVTMVMVCSRDHGMVIIPMQQPVGDQRL
jgi:hypothetical protein